MVFRKLLVCCSLLVALPTQSVLGEGPNATPAWFEDSFEQDTRKGRMAVRGEWEVADGMIAVTQDDELYKKYKNHGPILTYPREFNNGIATVRFRGRDNKAIVFTMDGRPGHVVRLKMTPGKPAVLLAWTEGAERPTVLNRKLPAIKDGQWTELTVKANGEDVTVNLNGTETVAKFAGAARPKVNAKIGFSFGSIEISSFSLQPIQ